MSRGGNEEGLGVCCGVGKTNRALLLRFERDGKRKTPPTCAGPWGKVAFQRAQRQLDVALRGVDLPVCSSGKVVP